MKNTSSIQESPTSNPSTSGADEFLYLNAGKDYYPTKAQLVEEANKYRAASIKRRSLLKGSATVTLSLLAIWVINPEFSSEQYSTNYSERLNVTLKDGSNVHLNANSSVLMSNRLHTREVVISKGEASFTVKHELRPFTVNVDKSKVLDIGTIFNITKLDDSFITTVSEGEVEVQAGDEKYRLLTGHSIKVTANKGSDPYKVDLEMINAWQTGKIMFNGTPLKDAVAQIQRYRQEPIVLDDRLQNVKITGIYDITKIDTILQSLPSIFSLKVERLTDGKVIISKK